MAKVPALKQVELAGPHPMEDAMPEYSAAAKAGNHGGISPQGISRGHHYAFRVEDIEVAEAKLKSSGIIHWKITSAPNFLLTAEGQNSCGRC